MHAEKDGSGESPNPVMSTTAATSNRDSYCVVTKGTSSGDYSESVVVLYYGVEEAEIGSTASYQPWSPLDKSDRRETFWKDGRRLRVH
jgi:hypothetical protein